MTEVHGIGYHQVPSWRVHPRQPYVGRLQQKTVELCSTVRTELLYNVVTMGPTMFLARTAPIRQDL